MSAFLKYRVGREAYIKKLERSLERLNAVARGLPSGDAQHVDLGYHGPWQAAADTDVEEAQRYIKAAFYHLTRAGRQARGQRESAR